MSLLPHFRGYLVNSLEQSCQADQALECGFFKYFFSHENFRKKALGLLGF
jgi:hypothetical protein